MSKALSNTIFIIAGLIFLYFLAKELVNEHKVPTFQEYVASSTAAVGSSTEAQAPVDATSTRPAQISTSAFAQFLQSLASSSAASQKRQVETSSVDKNDLTKLETTTIYTSKGTVKAFVADTEQTREFGLSGQDRLPNGVGMLFVFDAPGKYGFWMKDMSFPLDLIWIDGNKRVAGVTKNVLPTSYPFVFMPPKDISYVVEMDAGSVAAFGLTTGTSISFSLK
jgi:uncharacterized membrane protein (UPF0127 family)